MAGLLVSVRSLDEARLAATAGVDLIDLKEPRFGSLGRVAPEVADDIARHLAPAHRLSMALGELAQWMPDDFRDCREIPAGILFGKIGLAGCAGASDWPSRWRRAIEALPPHCQPVAVAYADWRNAEAPDPQAVLSEAAANGCPALLVDTWGKRAGDIFAHLNSPELRKLFGKAMKFGLLTVLGGSLSLRNFQAALDLEPDYLAVRGAVCDGARDGGISAAKLHPLLRLVRAKKCL